MKTKFIHLDMLLATFLLAILLCGCDISNKIKIGEVRLGMYGDKSDSRLYYSYGTFSGIESNQVQVDQGQIIAFSYNLNVNKGSLIIEWQNPQGQVTWKQVFESQAQGSEVIPADLAGSHTIIIQGKDTAGSCDVSWDVK